MTKLILLDGGDNAPSIPEPFAALNLTPRPIQTDAIERCIAAFDSGKRFVILQAPTGCHARGAELLRADGTIVRVEDVKVGDKLHGTAEERTVLGLCRGRQQMARVVPVKGETFVVNLDHILTLEKCEKGDHNVNGPKIIDVKVSDWLKWNKTWKWIYKLVRLPGNFGGEPKLPLNPYILGLILGDGGLTNGTVQIHKTDIEVEVSLREEALKWGLELTPMHENGWRMSRGKAGNKPNPIKQVLRELKLDGIYSSQKFVPSTYLTADIKSRREILAGLMDTDGSLSNGCFDYISASEQLAKDITFLARSVGLAAYLKPCEKWCQTGAGGTYYRVSISGDCSTIPTRIARKKAPPRQQIKSVLHTGFSVELLEEDDYFGFTLDGDGRYLMADFTVTHNTGKSLLSAALAHHYGPTYVCTMTKQLQAQYVNDFGKLGARELKGRAAFECSEFEETCEVGEVEDCGAEGDCPYRINKAMAFASPFTICNYYSYLYNVRTRVDREGNVYRPIRPLLVCDEAHVCFPAGTPVDQKPIESYRIGDFATSYDEKSGSLVERRVTKTFKTPVSCLVRVHFSNSDTLVVTPNHPFFTNKGWNPARGLEGLKVKRGKAVTLPNISMCSMQKEVLDLGESKGKHPSKLQERSSGSLFNEMLSLPTAENRHTFMRGVRQENQGDRSTSKQSETIPENLLLNGMPICSTSMGDACNAKANALKSDECSKSNAYVGSQRESTTVALDARGLGSESSRREWERTNKAGANFENPARPGLGLEPYRFCETESGELPNALQDRHSSTSFEGRDRGGREKPLLKAGPRLQENDLFEWVGVDRVEVLEPGSDGTFGGLCPDGFVYNLEVEGTHTYTVGDGYVVHNCEETLMGYLEVNIDVDRLPFVVPEPPGAGAELNEFFDYLELVRDSAARYADAGHVPLKKKLQMMRMLAKIRMCLSRREIEEWIAEPWERQRRGFSLKPLTVGSFGERIFQYGERVLLMSATILGADVLTRCLGIEDYAYVEEPCPFPAENRRIVSANLPMQKRFREQSWPVMVEAVKRLLDHHGKEKGLLLTPSNEMLEYIGARLSDAQRRRLVFAFGENRMAGYNQHVNSKTPTVLAASGFWEGADLKDELARFIVIPSVPRPLFQGQIAARAKLDPRWYRVQALAQLLQGVGRAVRHEKDFAVTYILDQDFRREVLNPRSIIPQWIKEAVVIHDG